MIVGFHSIVLVIIQPSFKQPFSLVLLIQGGYWWPPAYSTWTPTIVSFSFSISLFVAQFTIFGSFSGPELPKPFWDPKRRFLGKSRATWIVDLCFSLKSCSPRIDLSNKLLFVSNGDRMLKLWPWEVDVPIYRNGVHSLALHLLGLCFWMFRVFHCFSIINKPCILLVTQFRGM